MALTCIRSWQMNQQPSLFFSREALKFYSQLHLHGSKVGGGEAQHVLNNAAQAILGSQRFMTEGSQEISLLVQLEKSHFTIFVSLFPSLRHQRGTKRKQLRRLTRAGENVNICQIWVVGKYMAICYIDLYVFLNV